MAELQHFKKESLKILGEKYSLAWWLWQRRSFLDWLAPPVKELEIKAKWFNEIQGSVKRQFQGHSQKGRDYSKRDATTAKRDVTTAKKEP